MRNLGFLHNAAVKRAVVVAVFLMSTVSGLSYAKNTVPAQKPSQNIVQNAVVADKPIQAQQDTASNGATRAPKIPPARTQIALERALTDQAYGKKETHTQWRKKDQSKANKPKSTKNPNMDLTSFGDSMALVVEWVFWVGLATFAIYLLSRIGEWSKWFGNFSQIKSPKKRARPSKVFGLEVTQESLPNDVTNQFHTLLKQGDYRSALALIYRASLIYLIYEHGLQIGRASTEGECIQLVGKLRPKHELQSFTSITKLWLPVAYAKKVPTNQELSDVLGHYVQHFDVNRIGQQLKTESQTKQVTL